MYVVIEDIDQDIIEIHDSTPDDNQHDLDGVYIAIEGTDGYLLTPERAREFATQLREYAQRADIRASDRRHAKEG